MKTIKKKSYARILLYFLTIGVLFSGCIKEEVPVIIPEASEVNSFIWNGLHDFYLWNSQVPELTNKKYAQVDSLNAFLNKYDDPQELFTSLLYKYEVVDKWSFLVDDAKTIDDWISGTSKSMGYDLRLVRLNTAGDLLGYVRYVFKNSPAEKAGLKRGDLFLKVNDQQLTISNYETLLFDTENYKLGFAKITDGTITPIDRTITMNAIELQENPINKDTIFIYDNKRIGYLVYNGFNADFDIPLNDVIKKFKDANIDRLVLDLRYNGGGSVQSSIYLASMIYGTDASKIFAKAQYNKGFHALLEREEGASYFNDYFTSIIDKTDKTPETAINTLNLNKIHIIVSDNTASASELLINGLRPYMNVTVVGINTTGKYTGSMTVKDWDEDWNVNPNHKWAMQPIVVKYANSLGVSDYIDGLTPNIVASEFSETGITANELSSILPFGDRNEKLLSVVLADIAGIPITAQTVKSAQVGFKKVADSDDFKPFANEMYINPKKMRK